MASYLSLLLLAVTFYVTISSARVIPAEPVSVMLDIYGNPVLFLREKRASLTQPIIPHRSMMFTGYYRPARRSYSGDQAAGVFAQGNAVSGGSYLAGVVPHLKTGPSPIDEPEISSAQAEAAPEPENIYPATYGQENHRGVQDQNTDSAASPEEPHEIPISDAEPHPYDIETPIAPETAVDNQDRPADVDAGSTVPAKPTPPVKKGKKTPIYEEDGEDDEDLEDEDEPAPFLPGKGNRRQGGSVPNLNNFFPMMFSFPGLSRRGGSSSGSPPGIVTAIANSYSTGKGGVASSVATAYGGSPAGKKARRAPAITEE